MASLIAKGERIAIAPAALAYLYQGLRQVSETTDSRQYDVEAHWHYLHGWTHIHVKGSFSTVEIPKYFTEQRYPVIMELAGATAATNIAKIRTFMFSTARMTDRFEVIHRSRTQNLHSHCFGKDFKDAIIEGGKPLLLSKSSYQSIVEYFIGMRPSWLSYRRHDFVILQEYNPNRVARQFGLTQAIPVNGLPHISNIEDFKSLRTLPLATRLEAAAMSWAFLFRIGTNSCFSIPPRDVATGVSHFWLLWMRHTFSSFLEMGFQRYSGGVRNPINMSTDRERSKGSNSHKRQRDTASTHENSQPTSRPEHSQHKKLRSISPVRPTRNESFPQPIILEPDVSIYNSLPVCLNKDQSEQQAAGEMEGNEPSFASREELLPMNQESLMNEEVANIEMDCQLEEVMASTSASACSQFSVFNNESTLKSQGSGIMIEVLNEADATSQGPIVSGLDQHEITYISEETPMIIAEEINKMENCPLNSITTSKPTLISEVVDFTSKIRSRVAKTPKYRLSQSLNLITATLHGFFADINIETLPELDDFCEQANSLLESAAVMGMKEHDLRHWESELRKVEYAIYSAQTNQIDQYIMDSEIAEATYKNLVEKVTPINEKLIEKRLALLKHEEKVAQTDAKVTRIAVEWEELEVKRQRLMQERELVNQEFTNIKAECAQIKSQVNELEKISEPLSLQLGVAFQHLQDVRDRREHVIAQANAAMIVIKEIQAKYL